MLQGAGATVVGMSMVPEALPATTLEMRVLGICSLTNTSVSTSSTMRSSACRTRPAVAVGRSLVDLSPRMWEERAR